MSYSDKNYEIIKQQDGSLIEKIGSKETVYKKPFVPFSFEIEEIIAVTAGGKAVKVYMVDSMEIPGEFSLSNAYPNPFNPSTTINYFVDYESEIYITVYNLLGKKVRQLESSLKTPGTYSIQWDGKNNFNEEVSTGIYFIELKNTNLKDVRKVTFIK